MRSTMRVTIDATALLVRSAGVKNYIHHWIVHLRKVAGSHEILTFPFSSVFGRLDHERSEVSLARTVAGLARLHLLNRTRLPWRAGDIFHASNFIQNPPRGARLTSTVYDMTCWLYPELHKPSNVAVVKRFGERMLKRADGLIAISEATRQDAIRILGLDPDKVVVIHPGIAPRFFEVTRDDVNRVRGHYGLLRPYVLFVGAIEPRKNLPALCDAWGGSLPADFDLVVAGPLGWADAATRKRLETVRYLGYVPEADLPGLTAGASLFVYPSLYEGFGFPLAQAMAAGIPAVTSNVSCLPEIAGDAALLVDPRSASDIRAAIQKVLGSPSLAQQLAAAGRARASARYRWETCARQSIEFFERVCG